MTIKILIVDDEPDMRRLIEVKLKNEISVQPFTGEKMTGAGHAPILYAKDPRTDLPAQLQEQVQEAISGADEVIVAGWMEN